jgi:beta-glucosidase
MPASHNKLISEISSIQKNTVVVLTNGSAVAMPWINEVPAVLETWLGGQAGAAGTADVLFGEVNPSGKLAETFPVKLEDTPSFFNFPGEDGDALYGERIFVGYRYYDKKLIEPLFPFGHGLSYTSFAYSDLKISNKIITDQDSLTISLKVKNTGDVAGKEIVQIYVSDQKSSVLRPAKELKKFAKINLESGQVKEIVFTLEGRDFSYFDPHRKMWIAESGEFIISASASSRDIRLSETVQLKSTQQIPLAFDEYTFFREYWNNQQTRELLKELVPKWISQWAPEGKTLDDAVFHEFFIDHPLIKFPYITNGEITMKEVHQLVEDCKNFTYTP